jgi:uncharacterized protein YwgA
MDTKAQSAWNKIALLLMAQLVTQANPEPATHVVLQKHLFLAELEGRKRHIKPASYRFYRYTWGPFSNSLSWNIAEFEKLGFLDSESGQLLDRGKYLLDYVRPELDQSEMAAEALGTFEKTVREWKRYRGWSIVNAVYKLRVPVDGWGGKECTVKEIPEKTDILVPDRSLDREFQPLPLDLVDDIYSELEFPIERLDTSCEESRAAASELLETLLARA